MPENVTQKTYFLKKASMLYVVLQREIVLARLTGEVAQISSRIYTGDVFNS